jgi:hypothetical protein
MSFLLDQNPERQHEGNIANLISEFGHEDKVRELYNELRGEMESGAKIRTFIPILTYRRAYDTLSNGYLHGYEAHE